jgi:hypothetical protein
MKSKYSTAFSQSLLGLSLLSSFFFRYRGAVFGLDLNEIPDLLIHKKIFAKSLKFEYENFKFVDATILQHCLAGKNVILLGDSTMTEVTHDLAILLSGIGSDRIATKQFIHSSNNVRSSYLNIALPMNVSVDYFTNHRNMSIKMPDISLFIRHRFTGHHSLQDNFEGILSFNNLEFGDELRCILGLDDCPKPSFIVFNSGLHDIKALTNSSTYALHLDRLIEMFKLLTNATLIWRSNMLGKELVQLYPILPVLDSIAQDLSRKHNITYVNTTLAYDIINDNIPNSIQDMSYDFVHIGAIAEYNRKNPENHLLTLSSLATQILLQAICELK